MKMFSPGFRLGNKSAILFTIFFQFYNILIAQENLVPNGSFEEYNWCPSTVNGYYIDACKEWTSPSLGSPDYYNSCSQEYDAFLDRYLYSVPENYIGFQEARTGVGYAGVLYTEGNFPEVQTDQSYAEYIQVKLNQSLVKGNFYKLNFFVSNSAINICGNSIGALFTVSEIQENSDHVLNLSYQCQSDLDLFFCDSVKWFELNFIFQAIGNEKYMTIGTFTKLYESETSDYSGNIISGQGQYGGHSYLYIDDVSLIETDIVLSNSFTPNGDEINDIYSIDLNKIGAKKAEIFNRWGQLIASSDTVLNWDGSFHGNKCPDGVYFIRVEFELNSISGFIHLVR
jgi:gliding motility-associated-like protein